MTSDERPWVEKAADVVSAAIALEVANKKLWAAQDEVATATLNLRRAQAG